MTLPLLFLLLLFGGVLHDIAVVVFVNSLFNPLRPNSDLSQTSHCNIKGLSVSEVMRI